MDPPTNKVILHTSNYFDWKYFCQIHLHQRNLWSIVIQPPNLADRRHVEMNEAALTTIRRTLDRTNRILVRDCTTAKEAWDFLHKLYKIHPLTMFRLKQAFYHMHTHPNESGWEFVQRVMDTKHELDCRDIHIPAQDVSMVMLLNLPDEYEEFRTKYMKLHRYDYYDTVAAIRNHHNLLDKRSMWV